MMEKRGRDTAGWSLVELMVGLALGLLVAAAGTTAFYAIHAGYTMVADDIRLEQRGQQALDQVAALLRHAGLRPFETPFETPFEMAFEMPFQTPFDRTPEAPGFPMPASMPPVQPLPLIGSDDCGQPSLASPPGCGSRGIGASDAVLIRFGGVDGAGRPAYGDRYVTDCSGYPLVPRDERYARDGAINLLYVGLAADGEPQLLCRYIGHAGGWSSGALVRGVETLQLRYGVDGDGDGRVDRFLRASELSASGADNWRRVRAVQVAMVLRGDRRPARPSGPVPLLPARAAGETGDDIEFVPASQPGAVRRVFATTVWLRNAAACHAAPC